MKKLCVICAIALGITGTCAYAAPGDEIGDYYSTDIKTYLNGMQIRSINIGGQTLINAEAMSNYSFDVSYNESARELYITEVSQHSMGFAPSVGNTTEAPGTPIGKYYETDIKTILGGKEIPAYNTGGVTYIPAETLRDYGYDVVWNGDDRILSIKSPICAGYVNSFVLSAAEGQSDTEPSDKSIGAFYIKYSDGKITQKGDTFLFDTLFGENEYNWYMNLYFYQNQGLFYSDTLLSKIRSFVYKVRDNELKSPDELYDAINQYMSVKVNGIAADKIKISETMGNGHSDFEFEISGIPRIKKDEINEIEISFGDTSGCTENVIDAESLNTNKN